ncbi:hypothetical protein [Acetivibrio ethanolgignens]|uniref:Colicin D immunity protein domain-containing protein n=1 Tax=Acetivibrio ethanolgignens TaxID=290052 RepID=A0A0V8QC34_9FIRM|nr:hypothetical protein [Acetivibrio ethanolgignens]KSV58068.1 hypothetical protein ASU35_03265 [Acetivibrio ethanolgignens]
MNSKEKLIYLIINYNKGNYTTSDFCDLFIEYHRDMAEEEELSSFSEKWLDNLSEMCYRFSDSPEDLSIPNVYFDENKIKEYTTNFSTKLIY